MRIYPPCKDCPERSPACSDRCERFKEYRDQLAEYKKARSKYTQSAKVILTTKTRPHSSNSVFRRGREK